MADLTIYLLVLIAAFVGIVIWVFGRKRKGRFEKDAKIPFDDRKVEGHGPGSFLRLSASCRLGARSGANKQNI